MHQEAAQWVGRYASADPLRVLDIGGRNINGSAMAHFPNADRTVLDIAPGTGVDIVADAATWVPDREYQVVTCCEVAEHTASWPAIFATAYAACAAGGEFIVTTAGPGRAPHSAVDGRPRLFPGEHYANLEPHELATVLKAVGFVDLVVDQLGEDTRAWARKPMSATVCSCGKPIDAALVGRKVWATHADGCPDGQVRAHGRKP